MSDRIPLHQRDQLAGLTATGNRTLRDVAEAALSHARSMPAKPAPKARVRSRHRSGEMNRYERAYAELLERRRIAGEVSEFHFECVGLRLAPKTFAYLDFLVILADGTAELHEVKAGDKNGKPLVEDDALVKLKLAAELFPFTVKMLWLCKGGEWKERVFGAQEAE